MKKTMTSKKGFTLMEMVCVIAIVIFLGTIFTTSVVDYIGNAEAASAKVMEHQEYAVNRSADDVKSYLNGFTRGPAETTTQATIPVPVPGPAPSSAGGGTPTESEAPAPNPPPQTSTTQATTTTSAPEETTTVAPQEATTAAPDTPGEQTGTQTSGKIEATNGFVKGDQDKGVAKIVKSSDGKKVTVVIQNNKWNQLELTITMVNGKYVVSIANGSNNWMLSDANIFQGLWNGQTSWEVTPEIQKFFRDNYGLQIG